MQRRNLNWRKIRPLTKGLPYDKVINYRKLNRDNCAQAERDWKQGVISMDTLFFFLTILSVFSLCSLHISTFQEVILVKIRLRGEGFNV